MIKTVRDLRSHFPNNIRFAFFTSKGIRQENAMLDDKISNWCVTEEFSVVVILK